MKGKFTQFALGVLTGAFLFGGATAAAAGIMATPSWSPIYVDGQQVQMTAYNIGGNNFVKLRDIGQAVGFNVFYRNGVQVDSGTPYTGSAPAQAAQSSPAEAVRVGCYKDGPLTMGGSSGLIISPSGVEYTVTSSNPSVAVVEQVKGFWKVSAVSLGTAIITATGPEGTSGSTTVTVTGGSQAPAPSESGVPDLTANMEIRQEMVRLINQVRRENGKAELPVEESLMNAAQDVSAQCVGEHRPYDHQALLRYGWPYGGMYNLIVIDVNSFPDIAQKAVSAWTKSPGHFQTMVMDEGSCVGAGVTIKDGTAYCFMVVGDPTGHNPYE